MTLLASQPRLMSGSAHLELTAQGHRVWETSVDGEGWLQLLVLSGDGNEQDRLPPAGDLGDELIALDVACDGVRLSLRGGEALALDVDRVRAVRVSRYRVSFTEMSFVYVTLDGRARPSPVELDGRVVHLSADSLGFVLVRRDLMDAYASRVGAERLLERFTSTEEGNERMADGAILPVLGLIPWTYRLVFTREIEPPRIAGWAGPELARRGPFALGHGVELMLGSALERWPAEAVPIEGEADPRRLAVGIHASGPHGVGVGTYVFSPTDEHEAIDEPLINQDPAELFEAMYGVVDEEWIRGPSSGT